MRKPYILYVEDDGTSREVMEIILQYNLEHVDYAIFEDSTDFEARLKRLPRKPTLIFLDIHLQPYSGFELLQMIRSQPEYRNATIVALTASVMNEEIEELERAGFDCAIAKPIKHDVFPGIIQRIINGERIWYIV